MLGKGVQLRLAYKTAERLIAVTRSSERVFTDLNLAALRLVAIPQQASSVALLAVDTFQCQGGCADRIESAWLLCCSRISGAAGCRLFMVVPACSCEDGDPCLQ